MKLTLTLITVLLLAPLAALHGADFIIADKGIAAAPIIVFKDAPPRTRDAAVTLAKCIERISGQKPAIMDGEPEPMPERIAIAPGEARYHPQIRARAGLFNKLSLGDHKEGPDLEWARVQRLQLDSMELEGGHGFGDWWEKYSKSHPDYFALQPDGSRSPHPTPHNTKLCESNPKVWQQWLADAEEQLRANPTRRLFNVSENDGYDYGHCVCQDCLAKDHPDGEKFTFRWKGRQEERPALTDRQVQFANTLARMLKQRFPGRELYVQLLAYGYSRPAPIAAVPDDNVIIANVGNFAMRGPKERAVPLQQHADWAKKAKHLMWRPNLGNPAGLSWGMPDVAVTQLAGDFRFASETHCLGLYFDMFWYHWSTQGPLYYALAHLAWNPQTDVKALMDDYYQRTYGPAAADLKAYWELLERTRMEFVAENRSPYRAFDLPQKYTPGLFAKAQAHLDSAAAKLATADEKYRRRLHFTRCGLEFAKIVVDTRAGMREFEASKGKDEAAKARVLANWERTELMRKEFPPYAINWMAVFHTPGSAPGGKRDKRGEGLHPQSPITPYMLKRMHEVGLE